MDEAAGFVLAVLLGVLLIFIIVRIGKAASRTVDQEQKAKQGYPKASGPNDLVGPVPAPQRSPSGAKEIKLGMTPAEVEAHLGLPETKVDLGAKVLYKYKDMSIEFHDGKVTDAR